MALKNMCIYEESYYQTFSKKKKTIGWDDIGHKT